MTWNLQLRGPNGTVRRIQYDENERLEGLQSKTIASLAFQRLTRKNTDYIKQHLGYLADDRIQRMRSCECITRC